jgi:hypothetical protein
MKKTTLFLMFSLLAICSSVNAQTDFSTALPNNNGTSGNARAPQAADRYDRSVWIITATELAAAGYVNGDVISGIGFNYDSPADAVASGTFKVYLQNTTSTTNAKSTTWATAITGMTLASNATITIPATAGTVDFVFSGGSAFTYTGGGLYIATDYQNAAGPIATVGSIAKCNVSITGGIKGARSTTAIPATVAASDYRPETRLGKTVACAKPTSFDIPSTTLTSANIIFTSTNPVNIEYGAYDFVPGAGTTVSGVTSPYTLSGLTNSTAYEIYGKSDCGGFVGLSALAYGGSFHTTFIPANPNYNTSFEVDNLPNAGWLADAEANGSDWFINYGGPGSALVQNGNYSVVSLANTVGAASGIMYSRGVNLQANNPATITFYARNYLATSTNDASYVLTVGSEQTSASQTTTIATEPALSSLAYVLKTYTFTPSADGVYYFGLTNTSPAVASTAETQALIVDNFTVSQTLANNEVLDSKFSTYPNPAKNVINVANTTDALISNIEITDLNGRVVKNVKLSDVAEAQVSVSDLAQGVYTMKIVSDKGTAVKKVIKE